VSQCSPNYSATQYALLSALAVVPRVLMGAIAGKKLWLLVLATSLDTGIGGMGQAAFVAFLVSQCSPNYSATQYALLSALAVVPRVLMGAIAGQVVSVIGWANFFIVTCVTATPGLILLVIFRRRLNELAAREAAKR